MTEKSRREFSATFYGALAVVCGFVIVALAITGSYFITQAEIHSAQQAQQAQGQMFETNLCHTLNTLKAQKPPVGNPKTNPSRAFDQEQHQALAQLAADVGCPAIASTKP